MSTPKVFSQTAIYVNIYYSGIQGAQLVLDVDFNNNLTLSRYDSTSPTQVWQLIPNYSTGGTFLGCTLCNYSVQQCLYSYQTSGTDIVFGGNQTPYNVKNYCWLVITQNYPLDSNSENGVVTIRDYQALNCMTVQMNNSGMIIGVNLQAFSDGAPTTTQLWSLSTQSITPPTSN